MNVIDFNERRLKHIVKGNNGSTNSYTKTLQEYMTEALQAHNDNKSPAERLSKDFENFYWGEE